ncbi:hypothetical protein F8M41_018089, partial [Gigaspora margarita]
SKSLGQFDYYDHYGNYTHSQNLIEININKELGFLRAFLNDSRTINITQYSVNDNGNLEMLKTGNISSDLFTFTNFTLFTSFATIDERYAILYAKYSVNESNVMRQLGGLYVSFIAYSQTSMGNPMLLFQITRTGMKINAVHCNTFLGFCYQCVASIIHNNTVYYDEILFCSEIFLSSGQISKPPDEIGVPWNVSSTTFGGYIFSAVVNATCFIKIYDVVRSQVNLMYYNTTGIGAYSILKNNNTLLFSFRDTNSYNTSWSLLAVQLPKLSDGMLINAYS